MVEIIAVLALVAGLGATLAFFYLQTRVYQSYIERLQELVVKLPNEINKLTLEHKVAADKRFEGLLKDTFDKYLSHIERLEKLAVQPFTEKAVKQVLDRTGEVVANQIEQQLGEEGPAEFDLSAVPFGDPNLKIALDNDLPTEID